MDDVTAVLPAKYAEFMLQADNVDGRDIDKICRPLVIAAMLIADMEADLPAILIALGPVIEGDHFKIMLIAVVVAFAVDLTKISCKIRRIGGNTAAARRVSRDKGHLQRLEQAADKHYNTSQLYFPASILNFSLIIF